MSHLWFFKSYFLGCHIHITIALWRTEQLSTLHEVAVNDVVCMNLWLLLFKNHSTPIRRKNWVELFMHRQFFMIIWHCRSQLKNVDSGGIWSRTFGILARPSTCCAIESMGIGGKFSSNLTARDIRDPDSTLGYWPLLRWPRVWM